MGWLGSENVEVSCGQNSSFAIAHAKLARDGAAVGLDGVQCHEKLTLRSRVARLVDRYPKDGKFPLGQWLDQRAHCVFRNP